MRILFISILIFFVSCNNNETQSNKTSKQDSVKGAIVIDTIKNKPILKTLVLPPYDEITDEGISPDVRQYIDTALKNQKGLELIDFSFSKMMDINLEVFDKNDLKQIIPRLHPDVVIMSKIHLSKRTGNMTTDLWDIKLRVYNTISGQQKDLFHAEGISIAKMRDTINSMREKIAKAIVE